MRVILNVVLTILIATSAKAGQVAVTPPNAIVSVPVPVVEPTLGIVGATSLLGLIGIVPSLGSLSAAGGEMGTGGEPSSPANLQAMTQQVLSFDVSRLTEVQARRAIPLLELVIASSPAWLSPSELALLDGQLSELRAMERQTVSR